MVDTVLIILALACFLFAALRAQERFDLVAMGLFLWCLTEIVP